MKWTESLLTQSALLKLSDSSQHVILVCWLLLFIIFFFCGVFLASYLLPVMMWQDIILNKSCMKTFFLGLLPKFLKHSIYQIAAFFWNFLIKLLSFICIDHRCRIRLFNIYFRFKKKKKWSSAETLTYKCLVHNGSYIKYLKEWHWFPVDELTLIKSLYSDVISLIIWKKFCHNFHYNLVLSRV